MRNLKKYEGITPAFYACYDKEGNTYNINADTAAARIAGELGAESLISMTDIDGILRDKNDPLTLIRKIYASDAPQLMREGIISGGMIPKVNCCIEAIRRGVRKVFIIDGRIPHSILIETLTDAGIGTMFVSGDKLSLSRTRHGYIAFHAPRSLAVKVLGMRIFLFILSYASSPYVLELHDICKLFSVDSLRIIDCSV